MTAGLSDFSVQADCALSVARQKIRAVLAASPVPEDAGHAENTVDWLLRLQPHADEALQLAALAHDIERARPERLRREQFSDYDSFKAAHAQKGALLAEKVLVQAGISDMIRIETCRLIRLHEVGGDARSDLLKDADSLSYFDHNLPLYFAREGREETLRRARWGYARLSERARGHYMQIEHEDTRLQQVLIEAAEALS